MRKLTIEHNGASITVREPVGMDAFTSPALTRMVMDKLLPGIDHEDIPELQWATIGGISNMILYTHSAENLPFSIPGAMASPDEISQFFDQVLYDSEYTDLIRRWKQAISDIQKPPVEAPEAETDDKTA